MSRSRTGKCVGGPFNGQVKENMSDWTLHDFSGAGRYRWVDCEWQWEAAETNSPPVTVNEILAAAKRHNYATLLLKLRKEGFSQQEALRRADLIMPDSK
jgi:hypothetical protein